MFLVPAWRDPKTLILQVYLPCVLQTKKRYVGYMYESLDQKEPVFDAKGIETVRRDGCPAVSKVTGSFCLHLNCAVRLLHTPVGSHSTQSL